MRPRGVKDIPTMQGRVRKTSGDDREKSVSDLARQEHERARLQRELSVWAAKKEQTEKQLQTVQERIQTLEQALYEARPDAPARSGAKTNEEGQGTTQWREVSIEY